MVKTLRGNQDMRKFSRKLGVSAFAVNSWEKEMGNPRPKSLERLAAITGNTLEQLKAYLDGNIDLQNYLKTYLQYPSDQSLACNEVLEVLPSLSLPEKALILKVLSDLIFAELASGNGVSRYD